MARSPENLKKRGYLYKCSIIKVGDCVPGSLVRRTYCVLYVQCSTRSLAVMLYNVMWHLDIFMIMDNPTQRLCKVSTPSLAKRCSSDKICTGIQTLSIEFALCTNLMQTLKLDTPLWLTCGQQQVCWRQQNHPSHVATQSPVARVLDAHWIVLDIKVIQGIVCLHDVKVGLLYALCQPCVLSTTVPMPETWSTATAHVRVYGVAYFGRLLTMLICATHHLGPEEAEDVRQGKSAHWVLIPGTREVEAALHTITSTTYANRVLGWRYNNDWWTICFLWCCLYGSGSGFMSRQTILMMCKHLGGDTYRTFTACARRCRVNDKQYRESDRSPGSTGWPALCKTQNMTNIRSIPCCSMLWLANLVCMKEGWHRAPPGLAIGWAPAHPMDSTNAEMYYMTSKTRTHLLGVHMPACAADLMFPLESLAFELLWQEPSLETLKTKFVKICLIIHILTLPELTAEFSARDCRCSTRNCQN